MSAELMEMIQTISQIMANTYDGARDENGERIKVGLRREKVPEFRSCDCRLLDGFVAKVTHMCDKSHAFPCLVINYQSELKLDEVHKPGLNDELQSMISECVKYLKKEFKKATGKELKLAMEGEMIVRLEELSRIRNLVSAQCHYQIKNLSLGDLEDEKDVKRAEEFKKWLSLGGIKK